MNPKVRQVLFRETGGGGYGKAQHLAYRLRGDGYAAEQGSISSPAGSWADSIYIMTDAPLPVIRRMAREESLRLATDLNPPTVRLRRGVWYYPSYEQARAAAITFGWPTDRIISYGLGWAVQRERSGEYLGPGSEGGMRHNAGDVHIDIDSHKGEHVQRASNPRRARTTGGRIAELVREGYPDGHGQAGAIAYRETRAGLLRANPPLESVEAIGPNMIEVIHGRVKGLYSYKTPVAIMTEGHVYRSSQFHSTTTSKHIGQWLKLYNLSIKQAQALSQQEIEDAVRNGSLTGTNPVPSKRLRRAVDFFRKHAGGVVGEAAAGALALARAEAESEERGWGVEILPDPEGTADGEYPAWVYILKDESGTVLASLGGVDVDGGPYARVVGAELALEALGEE